MERKTLGAFIAALQKEKGLTQKQLAEKLNVTDKSVSRCEQEESAPDLCLIPEIADIFGITADELLRGRCRKAAAHTDTTNQPQLNAAYQILTIISFSLIIYRIRKRKI